MANAKPREVAAALAALHDYDADYLECRRGNLGHLWRAVGYFRGERAETLRLVECQRCETTRVDRWGRGGVERLPSRYHYGEGYRLPGTQPDTAAIRGEVLRRATVYASEADMLAAITNGGGK